MSKKPNKKAVPVKVPTAYELYDMEQILKSKDFATDACQQWVDQIQKMVEDRDAKCESAKAQLIESLKITADKYRTATGPMEALRVMRMVNDGKPEDMQIFEELEQARNLAADMVAEVSKLHDKAEKLGWAEMDQLCKDSYSEDFLSDGFSAMDLCFELMRLDLCRNVGPAAEDMVSFIDRSQEEINAVKEKVDQVVEKYPDLKDLKPSGFAEE